MQLQLYFSLKSTQLNCLYYPPTTTATPSLNSTQFNLQLIYLKNISQLNAILCLRNLLQKHPQRNSIPFFNSIQLNSTGSLLLYRLTLHLVLNIFSRETFNSTQFLFSTQFNSTQLVHFSNIDWPSILSLKLSPEIPSTQLNFFFQLNSTQLNWLTLFNSRIRVRLGQG